MSQTAETIAAASTLTLEFWPADVTPPIPAGHMKQLMVCVRRGWKKKITANQTPYIFAAYYLNAYPLEYEDGCGECKDDGSHEDGCPTTGWFYDESNFQYDNCYHKLLGDGDQLIGWASVPQPTDALLAALAEAQS